MITPGQRCIGGCGLPMIRAKTGRGTPETPPPGWRRHSCRGICEICYRASISIRSAGGARPGRPRNGSEDDVDWVKVQRVIQGADLPLTGAELRMAVEQMTVLRVPTREIARRLRICDRTVTRYRAQATGSAA